MLQVIGGSVGICLLGAGVESPRCPGGSRRGVVDIRAGHQGAGLWGVLFPQVVAVGIGGKDCSRQSLGGQPVHAVCQWGTCIAGSCQE